MLDPDGIELTGTLYDGQGEPIPDGMVEVWDARRQALGALRDKEREGGFMFRVPRDADCLEVFVFARGCCATSARGSTCARPRTTCCRALEPPDRQTLLARREGGALRFDIRMQGEGATVFFEH